MSVAEIRPSYGSTSREHCRRCGEVTTFRWVGCENHSIPRVDTWTCAVCGHQRTQMADVTDSEGLLRTILDRKLAGSGANVDRAEAMSLLRMELWDLYLAWDPTVGVRFRAYAVGLLRLRINNLWRNDLGRDVPKAHVGALSLDAPLGDEGPELGGLVGSSQGDPGVDSCAGLMRAIAQGSRGATQPLPPGDRGAASARRRQRGVGRVEDAGAAS